MTAEAKPDQGPPGGEKRTGETIETLAAGAAKPRAPLDEAALRDELTSAGFIGGVQAPGNAQSLQERLRETFAPDAAPAADPVPDTPPPSVEEEAAPEQETAPEAPAGADDGSAGRSRNSTIIKSVIGVVLLVAVGWLPALRLLQVSSVEAVVNGRVVTLRAPISGEIQSLQNGLQVGDTLGQGRVIMRIENPRQDRTRLNQLQRELNTARDEQTLLGAEEIRLRAMRGELEAQVANFRDGRIGQLNARMAMLSADLGAAQASLEEAEANLARQDRLLDSGFISAAGHQRAQRDKVIAQERVNSLVAQIDGAQVELDSLRNGVFVGDSYNDRPQSSQRIDDLDQRLIALGTDAEKANAQIARLEGMVAREQDYVGTLASADVTVPARGRIWEVFTSPGEQVGTGQDLVSLLNCSEAVVTATVSESVYNQLSIGSKARFRFREGGEPLAGEVVQLTGLATAPANFAIQPSALIKESYRVTVAVPQLAEGGNCQVGRTGRVVFGEGGIVSKLWF